MNEQNKKINWKIVVGVVIGVITLIVISLSVAFGLKNTHSKYWIEITDWNSPKNISEKGSASFTSPVKSNGRIEGEWDLNGKIDFNKKGDIDTIYLENSSWDITYYYDSVVDFSEKVEFEQFFMFDNGEYLSEFTTNGEYSIQTNSFTETASADFMGIQVRDETTLIPSTIQTGVNADIKYNGEYADSFGHVIDGHDFTFVNEGSDILVDSDEFTMDYFRPEFNSHFNSYV